jgi:hypothetical protein
LKTTQAIPSFLKPTISIQNSLVIQQNEESYQSLSELGQSPNTPEMT